jgi:hypothetical protein
MLHKVSTPVCGSIPEIKSVQNLKILKMLFADIGRCLRAVLEKTN